MILKTFYNFTMTKTRRLMNCKGVYSEYESIDRQGSL